MPLPELRQLLLVVGEPAARLLELRLEELAGLVGLHGAVLQVLRDELRRQALGHLHRRARVFRRERHGEEPGLLARTRGLRDLHADVPPHQLDDVLHDHRAALLFVEIQVLDDALESRPALNLLADRLKPGIEAAS